MAKYTHIVKGNFSPTDIKNIYSRINVNSMFAALSDLNTMGAVKLWFYLTVRLNNEESWDLSPKECVNSIGLKDDALRDAKKLMVKKGYLENLGDDNYIFHQVPIKTEEEEKPQTKMSDLHTTQNTINWEF